MLSYIETSVHVMMIIGVILPPSVSTIPSLCTFCQITGDSLTAFRHLSYISADLLLRDCVSGRLDSYLEF